ncbi:hypothetical protein JCM4914_46930 [Streptomyces platensis subsp. malvinus]
MLRRPLEPKGVAGRFPSPRKRGARCAVSAFVAHCRRPLATARRPTASGRRPRSLRAAGSELRAADPELRAADPELRAATSSTEDSGAQEGTPFSGSHPPADRLSLA